MIVTSCWLPVEHGAEARLVSALVQDGRRFTKGLRYNLPRTRPLASIVLTDTPEPVAMHVMPPGAPNAYREAVQELIEDSHFGSWLWNPESDPLPPLPTRADGHAAPPSNAERRDGTDRHL